MSEGLTEKDRTAFRAPNFAWVVTLDPDGSPQASVTWVDNDETHLLVNTAEGRRKDRNVARDPRVVIGVQDGGDAYDWISVEGVVDERETGPRALDHIDRLSRAYDGEPWTPVEGQVRVLWHVRPTRVIRYKES
jgi:PPOX class probable F420-dependent enzyme